MSPRTIACFVGLAAYLAVGQAVLSDEPPLGISDELTMEVDRLFAKWNRLDSPGCAVGIIKGGQLVYSKGFGSSNLEYRVPNTTQTVFETASFTKSVTCVCLALLMDEGKITPEDDLRKFIPEMQIFDPPIRIADMVRCRSGLWDHISVPTLIGWENSAITEADFFSLIRGQKTLPFQPGTEFRYSSGDYFLLGIIIQRLSGSSLPDFARQRIFEPLGMKRTSFDDDPTRIVEQRAFGHHKPHGDDWRLMTIHGGLVGGGGLNSCVDDLVVWDRNFTDNKLPKGRYLDELLREGSLLGNRYCLDVDAYVKELNPDAGRDSPAGQYRGLRRRQFTGGAWGLSTAMTQFLDEGWTFICLSNCSEIAAWTMNARMADLLLASRLAPLSVKPSERSTSDQPAVQLSEADLREKVGTYRVRSTGHIWRIAIKDGSLHVTDHLLKTHWLRPLGAMRFDPEGPFFYESTQFVFSRTQPTSPIRLASQWNEPGNKGRLEFENVQLVEPTPDQLTKYVGHYISDELAASHRFLVRDGQLWLRVNSRRWEQLDATVHDEFIPHIREPSDGRIIRFVRNKNDEVTGLSIDSYRITNVRFEKR
jgi:CubicO group peptidase (beta-lactamase class C family)